MKLSPAAEIAVRGVLVLAEQYGQGPVTLQRICERRKLPRQYLVKIFADLARAGLIQPVRGKHGGFQLAREPGGITVLQVVEAVEGPIALNLCQHSPPQCPDIECRIRPVWSRLQKAVRDELGKLTLAQCVAEADATCRKPQRGQAG